MNEAGYGVLPGYLPQHAISNTLRFVSKELERHRGEYFSYIGRDPVAGTPLSELGSSPIFQNILARVYEHGTGKPAPPEGLYQVLRVLSGLTGMKEAYQFHYDAYVVTAAVPIAIPSHPDERRGDLIIYPRLRRIRSNAMVNVVEKMILQNRLVQLAMSTRLMQYLFRARKLRMEPGNIYFFWGYQSLHGNEPCLPRSLRSTALFHLVDPHENSFLTRTIQAWRRRHEARIREKQFVAS
jgi:hypothetical protein